MINNQLMGEYLSKTKFALHEVNVVYIESLSQLPLEWLLNITAKFDR